MAPKQTRINSAAPEKTQIKSRKRVADHGEVFTAEREVNAMLDLVKDESERVAARFLEPACGDGNFLAAILRRKLRVIKNCCGANRGDWTRYAIVAVAHLYGIELLADNAQQCRVRLADIVAEDYRADFGETLPEKVGAAVEFILSQNIVWGDALTLKRIDDGTPIVFPEWTFNDQNRVRRRDFRFGDLAQEQETWLFSGANNYEPAPIKEYRLTPYLKIAEAKEMKSRRKK